LIYSKYSLAQKTKIIGKIVNSIENIPVQGAVVKYGKSVTISDKNGLFTLNVFDLAEKSAINITAIGYKKIIFDDFDFKKLINVILEDSTSSLSDITITSGTNALIKKAIENISINYSQKSFTQTGILRLFYDIDNGYHYQNDAIIENFIPPYNSQNEISVRLKGNKSYLYYDYDSTNILVRNWFQAYKIVANQDIVHRPQNFLSLKKISSYNYKLIDKYSYGNYRLFEIEFSSKDGISGVNYKKVYGKLLIDSASLAFVKADLVFEDINNPLYVGKNKYYLTVEYKRNENLWYLDKIKSESISKKTNNIISHTKVFYVAIDNDTTLKKDFTYLEKIQNFDITQNLNIPIKKQDSMRFFVLFEKAENDSLFPLKDKYFSNIIQNKISKDSNSHIHKYKNYFFRIQKYFNSGNVTYGLNSYQLPFKIEKNDFNFYTNTNYTIGFSLKFRVYHNLFYLVDTYFNTKTIPLSNNENTGSNAFKYDFNYKFANRIFTISPILGFNKIKISNTTNSLYKIIYNYHYGISHEYELTHKMRLQLTSIYNVNYKSTGNKFDFITPMPYSFSFGINMKL
jgi:hypothetical protein